MVEDDEEDTRTQIQKNQEILRGNLSLYSEHYWPIYREYGMTFGEGYRAFLIEHTSSDDEEDEPWRET
jgi:hypothetical protein